MSTEELKACPFCGKTHTLIIARASEMFGIEDEPWTHGESFAVVCDAQKPNGPGGCGSSGCYKPTEAEAIKTWNVRAPSQQAVAMGEPVVIDWESETNDPLKELDAIYDVYSKSFGKPAPDAEMAYLMRKTRAMLFDWWAWHRDAIRYALATPPAATARVGLSEEAFLKILLSSVEFCGRVALKYTAFTNTDIGDLERPTFVAEKLLRAIEAAHGIPVHTDKGEG